MRIGPIDPQHDLWNSYVRLVTPHDRSTEVTQAVSIPAPVTPWVNVISDVLVAFSSVVIILAVLWMVWQSISAVVNASWSGEAISREWHSIWGPLRIVLGLTMIMPIANGNNLAQLLVIQTSVWSGQVANTIYVATLRAMTPNQTNAGMIYSDSDLAAVFRNFYLIELCSRSVMHADGLESIARGQRSARLGAVQSGRAATDPSSQIGVHVDQTRDGVIIRGHDICPHMRISWVVPERSSWLTAIGMSTSDHERLRQLWMNSLRNIADSLRPIGERLMRGALGSGGRGERATEEPGEALTRWMGDSIRTWRETSNQAMQIVREAWERGGRREDAERLGWLYAPALMWQRSGMMRDSWAVARVIPEVTNRAAFEAAMHDPANRTRFERFHAMVAALHDEGLGLVASNSGMQAQNNAALQSDASAQTAQNWGLIPRIDLNRGSPILQVADWGFWLMEVGTVTWTAAAAGSFTTTVTGSLAQVGGAAAGPGGIAADILSRLVGGAMSIGMVVGGVMILVGALHAYVLPAMPMIIFIVFALGCLVLLVEALIAAPVWALGHIRLSGQGMVDNTQLPGYQILLGLFLRIPIAMIAYVFSLLVTDVSLWGVSQIMGPQVGGMVSSWSGFGVVTYLLIYGFISWQVCIRSFGMINALPDKVLRWIQIQSIADRDDDGQRGTTGLVVMGMQRAGVATQAASASMLGRPGQAAAAGVRGLVGPGGGRGGASMMRPAGQGASANFYANTSASGNSGSVSSSSFQDIGDEDRSISNGSSRRNSRRNEATGGNTRSTGNGQGASRLNRNSESSDSV